MEFNKSDCSGQNKKKVKQNFKTYLKMLNQITLESKFKHTVHGLLVDGISRHFFPKKSLFLLLEILNKEKNPCKNRIPKSYFFNFR